MTGSPAVTAKRVVTHPATMLGVFGSLLSVSGLWGLVTATWASLGSWFTVVSMAAWTFGPKVSWLPESWLTDAAIVLSLAFAAKLIWETYKRYAETL